MARNKPTRFASNHVGGRLHSMCAAFVRNQYPDIYQQFKDHIYAQLGIERRGNRQRTAAEQAVADILDRNKSGAAQSNSKRKEGKVSEGLRNKS